MCIQCSFYNALLNKLHSMRFMRGFIKLFLLLVRPLNKLSEQQLNLFRLNFRNTHLVLFVELFNEKETVFEDNGTV